MDKSRVLVLGDGLLGGNFKSRGYEVLGRDQFEWTVWGSRYKGDRCLSSHLFPYGDNQTAYDIIINTVAYTDTQRANIDVTKCHAVNVKLPEYLNLVCGQEHKLVHISTGSVYLNSPHNYVKWEEDAPVSVYAATKFLGDAFVNKQKHIVIRPQMVFGQDHRESNLFDKLNAYDNVMCNYFSMTSTDTIVEAIEALLKAEAVGAFNVAQTGQASPEDAGQYINTTFSKRMEMNTLKENKVLTSPNIELDLQKLKQYYEPREIHEELSRVGKLWLEKN